MKKYIAFFLLLPFSASAQKKVGVGTIAPEQRLSVDSTVNIDQGNFDDGTKPALRFGSLSSEAIGSRRVAGGANPFGLDFFTNNTKRISITQDGKVGIGTTAPYYALHIVAKAGDQAVTFSEGSDANFVSHYTNSTNTTSFVGSGFLRQGIVRGYVGINPNNDMFLARVRPSQGLQAALTVSNSSGKVGIGMSVPSYALDVFDAENDAFITHFNSRNPSASVVRIENTAPGTNLSEISLGFFRNDVFKGKLSVDPTDNLLLSTDVFGSPHLAITPNGRVGIGTATPSYTLDVLNFTNDAFIAHFTGSSAAGSTVRIENTAGGTNTSEVSLAFFRSDVFKGSLLVDPTNNLVLSTDPFGTPHLAVTPSGNVGIGRTDANFPLNFTNSLGDKIALYGNTANTYGFGVQNNLLQIHTDGVGSDVAIGSGSSAAFTERMRVKGNGNVGIGTTGPQQNLSVNAGMNIDQSSTNNGTITNTLTFGGGSGEGIGSKRTAGGNNNGLDLYTANAARLSIMNGGNVGVGTNAPAQKLEVNGNAAVDGNLTVGASNFGIVRNSGTAQMKIVNTSVVVNPGGGIGAGATINLPVTFSQTFSSAPLVYIGSCNGSGGWAESVMTTTAASNTGCTLWIFNPRGVAVNPNFTVSIIAIGAP